MMAESAPTRLVLSAGMKRSGSTWLFNAARVLLEQQLEDASGLSAGWIDDVQHLPRKQMNLWKLHEYDQDLVDQSDIILFCFRDLRDVLASQERKFGSKPSLSSAKALVDSHQAWQAEADLTLKYEDMISNTAQALGDLAQVLNVTAAGLGDIEHEITALDFDSPGSKNERYNLKNLYHRGHVTHGGIKTWQDQISPELIKSLETEFRDWFLTHDYELYFVD